MNRPDFSGKWTFNKKESSLEIKAPDSTTFIIEHNEPDFTLTRTHIVADREDTFSIHLTTNNKSIHFKHGPYHIDARLRWDHDDLIFDSVLMRNHEKATNIVRYTLKNGGKKFVANEKFTSKELSYHNIWVFQKK